MRVVGLEGQQVILPPLGHLQGPLLCHRVGIGLVGCGLEDGHLHRAGRLNPERGQVLVEPELRDYFPLRLDERVERHADTNSHTVRRSMRHARNGSFVNTEIGEIGESAERKKEQCVFLFSSISPVSAISVFTLARWFPVRHTNVGRERSGAALRWPRRVEVNG
jgi:hypothetical protein